jgi:hypothetical protein
MARVDFGEPRWLPRLNISKIFALKYQRGFEKRYHRRKDNVLPNYPKSIQKPQSADESALASSSSLAPHLSFHDSYANRIWRKIHPHIQASSGISLPANLILFAQLLVRACAAPTSPPVETVPHQLVVYLQEFFITSLTNILHWWCPIAFTAAIIAIVRRYSTRDPIHVFRITSAISAIASLAAGDGSTRPEARFSATVIGITLLLHYWARLFPGTLAAKDVAWPTVILSAALGLDGLICHFIAPNQGVDPALFVQLLLISFWLSLTLLSGLRPVLRHTRESLLLSMEGEVPVASVYSTHAA